jgi:tRNA (cytosine34-C5)-methyltransferase
VKCVWSGVKVFEKRGTALGERRELIEEGTDGRGPVTGEGASAYRLTQEGAIILADYVGDERKFSMPARDLKHLLKEPGKEVPLKSFTPAVANAARQLRPGSIIVELRKAGGGGAAEVDDSCPPLAVELTAAGSLKIDWRYRKGLEGAPKAAAAAILRRLDGPSGGGYEHGYGGDEEWAEDDGQFY